MIHVDLVSDSLLYCHAKSTPMTETTREHQKVKRAKVPVGITLDQENYEYLERLKKESGLDRTWVINAIIREHRRLVESKILSPLVNPAEQIIRI